jgi:hypothetical protein
MIYHNAEIETYVMRHLLWCSSTEALMNRVFGQRNIDWLEARIREAEGNIVAAKIQLQELESQGSNTGEACWRLAIATEYLHLLNLRREAALEKLRRPANSDH